jgi:HEPN domain-containing protein
MDTEILLNDFATRSFRDIADQDYISARLSYRHGLYPQFHWQSLQAIEKYLKAILLYNRIKATDINYDLDKAIKYIGKLQFEILRSESTDNFIKHLSNFGRFRYLESSYCIHGPKIVELDKAVWEIRRYCTVLNHEVKLSDGKKKNLLEIKLERSTTKIQINWRAARKNYRYPETYIQKCTDLAKCIFWTNNSYACKGSNSFQCC